MKIFLFDSLSRKKKEFVPIKPDSVGIYACGPTVYDYAHVGNARMAVITDLLVKTLKCKYKTVKFVSNITDVDDKIIKASKDLGIPIEKLTQKYHEIYNQDMTSLNVDEPNVQPKATEFIEDMITMIEKLIKNECAYIVNNYVYFDVTSYKYYGSLSRRSLDEQIAGARVEVGKYKKNPRDFILWKPSKEEDPGWSSPWGRGRPGWHIECSTMSDKCLDTPFDIHCGGVDLTFPHHENEIAQSCSAIKKNSNPSEFCNYWFHNGFVTFEGEKMSKSIGNIQLVNDLLKRYDGKVIRLSLLSAHYRQPLNWTEKVLQQSKQTLTRIYKNLERIKVNTALKIDIKENEYFDKVKECLFDDLNTPKALSVINKYINIIETKVDDQNKIYQAIFEGLRLLGLKNDTAIKEFSNLETLEKLLKERNEARKSRDFKKADAIRETLKKQGIEIEDTSKGTVWTKIR